MFKSQPRITALLGALALGLGFLFVGKVASAQPAAPAPTANASTPTPSQAEEKLPTSAAIERNVPIRWGGNWDLLLTGTDSPTDDIIQNYIQKRINAGRKPFVDAPHFELPLVHYPIK